jgi:hypothetical protein
MLNFFKKNAAYLGKKTCSKGRGIQKKCRKNQENLLSPRKHSSKNTFRAGT